MLQARIVSTRGSLYFASEVTPYDLENLRTHVRDFQATMSSREVRVEVSLDGCEAGRAAELQVNAWLRKLVADGVHVSLSSSTPLDRVMAAASLPRRHRP